MLSVVDQQIERRIDVADRQIERRVDVADQQIERRERNREKSHGTEAEPGR